MSRFLFSLVLILGICNAPISTAHADEPAPPLSIVAPASSGTPPINRRGLRNKPAVVVGYDAQTGCPVAFTNGPQFMQAGDVGVFAAAADARARCVRAAAEAKATVTKAEAAAASEILLANSTSEAIRTASTYSEPVNVVGMAATGTAANIGAGNGTMGGGWGGQGANLLSAFYAVNNGGTYGAPPPTQPQRSISDNTITVTEEVVEEAEPELTPEQQLAEAETRARAAMVRAGIK